MSAVIPPSSPVAQAVVRVAKEFCPEALDPNNTGSVDLVITPADSIENAVIAQCRSRVGPFGWIAKRSVIVPIENTTERKTK